jgi:hypothetical protein
MSCGNGYGSVVAAHSPLLAPNWATRSTPRSRNRRNGFWSICAHQYTCSLNMSCLAKYMCSFGKYISSFGERHLLLRQTHALMCS